MKEWWYEGNARVFHLFSVPYFTLVLFVKTLEQLTTLTEVKNIWKIVRDPKVGA